MSVLEFKKPEPHVPHGTGMALCIACLHEWMAVAPTGTIALECPSCHLHKGRWKFDFYPNEGQMVRSCNCGNQLFYLTPNGHMCANCGTLQEY